MRITSADHGYSAGGPRGGRPAPKKRGRWRALLRVLLGLVVGSAAFLSAPAAAHAAATCNYFYIAGGDGQTTPVGDFFPQALQVQLAGCSGDPSGLQVTFSAGTNATPTAPSATVGSDGIAQVAAIAGSTVGAATVTASFGALTPVTFHLTVNNTGVASPAPSEGCTDLSYVFGDGQSTTPGAYFPDALKVRLTCDPDASGQQVLFTSSDPSIVNVGAPAGVTGPDGVAQMAAVAGGSTGTATVTASYGNLTSVTFTLTVDSNGVVTGGPSASCTSLSYVSGGGQQATPGAVFTNALLADLSCGSTSPAGQHVTFTSSDTSIATVGSTTPVVGADGIVTDAVVAGSNPGTVTITASYGSLSPVYFHLTVIPSGT